MTTPQFVGSVRLAAMGNMAMLYAGKTSGLLVAFIFLPLYSRLLGPVQFGMVAVILSMQALLMMLDLGMSTIVSRDFAMGRSDSIETPKLIQTAEFVLTVFYIILLIGTAIYKLGGGLPGVGVSTVFGSVILFWLLVLQNLYYTAMLARRAYSIASTVQVIGVTVRAGITAYVLANVSATLTAFVITQIILAAIHLGVTRLGFRSFVNQNLTLDGATKQPTFKEAFALIKRVRSLVLFAVAGAAVTQLDKPIVSALTSAADVAPYFLATTLCMVPISVLAGPVSQYFQPMLLNAMAHPEKVSTRRVIKHFASILLAVTLLPSVGFWLLRTPMIELWMGQNSSNAIIANYVKILLPGFTLGALGFIPFSLLISAKDFKFQATLSVFMTVVTLIGATAFALSKNIEGVCYVYAGYYTISTLLSWLRAIHLPATKELAKISFSIAMVYLSVLSFFVATVNYVFQ